MGSLFLVFTPVAPPFTEVAAAFRDFPGGWPAPGELFDLLAVCEPGIPTGAGEPGTPECVAIVPGLRDTHAEAQRLAKHWPAGLAPEEVEVLRLDYDRTTVGLVRRVMTELAPRFRFFVETADGKLHSGEGFARRCVREPGAWWEGAGTRPGAPSGFAADVLPVVTDSEGGRATRGAASVAEASDGITLPGPGRFAVWRPLGDWQPPGAPGDGQLAILAVASLPSGPALELSGRMVPGLLGWFGRRLRAWEKELRARETDLLRRPAAYLFVAARVAGPEEAQGSERLAWYPGVIESVRGYGDASNGPGGWVDLHLGELLERAARLLEAG